MIEELSLTTRTVTFAKQILDVRYICDVGLDDFKPNTVQLVNKDGALRWLGGLWMVLVVCAFGGPFEDFAFDDARV